MAKQTNKYEPKGFRTIGQKISAADTTTAVDVLAAGTDDSTVTHFSVANESTDNVIIELILHDGTDSFVVNTVTVEGRAGFSGGLPPLDLLAQPFVYGATINLQAGWTLQARARETLVEDLTFTATVTDY